MKFKVKADREARNRVVSGQRMAEYPALSEFADAYYWSQRGNAAPMEAYLAKVDAVKAKNPKLK